MEELLNEKFKTKTKEGRDTANYQHALRFIELLKKHADGVTNKKQLTQDYLDKYFRSAATRGKVIKILKELGIIESSKSYVTGVKGKDYRLHNDYLPEELKSKYMINPLDINKLLSNPNGTVEEEAFFKASPGPKGYSEMFGGDTEIPIQEMFTSTIPTSKDYTFMYRGIYEVTRTITAEDKEIVKEIISSNPETLLESVFMDECLTKGIDKEKSWFIFKTKKEKI
jgi:hypothetical protein